MLNRILFILFLSSRLTSQEFHRIDTSYTFSLSIQLNNLDTFGGVFELDSVDFINRDERAWSIYDMSDYLGLSGLLRLGDFVYIADNYHQNIKKVSLVNQSIVTISKTFKVPELSVYELWYHEGYIPGITDRKLLIVYNQNLELIEEIELDSEIELNRPVFHDSKGFIFKKGIRSDGFFGLFLVDSGWKLEDHTPESTTDLILNDVQVIDPNYANGAWYRRSFSSTCPGIITTDGYYYLEERLPTHNYYNNGFNGMNITFGKDFVLYYSVDTKKIKFVMVEYFESY